MDGFERRRQNKKNSILIAALTLFKQYGYSKVTIAEIAGKASVSQASIYNYFENKETLKQKLLMKLIDDYHYEITNIVESNDSIELKLEKLLISMTDIVKTSSKFLTESIENDTSVDEYLVEKRAKIKESIVKFFEEGKKKEIIDDSVSTDALITYIEIFEYYFNNNPKVASKFENNPELYVEVHSLFLKGIKSKLKLNI